MTGRAIVVAFTFLAVVSVERTRLQEPTASLLTKNSTSLHYQLPRFPWGHHRLESNFLQPFNQNRQPLVATESERVDAQNLTQGRDPPGLADEPGSIAVYEGSLDFPVEKVGVISRSVTFPQVLKYGEIILGADYFNASTFCVDVAHYAGLLTGLIWAMDRELVETNELHHLIDRADSLVFVCFSMLSPKEFTNEPNWEHRLQYVTTILQQNAGLAHWANSISAVSVSPIQKEETPDVSSHRVRAAISNDVKYLQERLRSAQTLK